MDQAGTQPQPQQQAFSALWPEVWDALKRTFHYWMETETHVYAFSVAANVLLSFFPFLVVICSLARLIFPKQVVRSAMDIALSDYFPQQMINPLLDSLMSPQRGSLEFVSILLLLFTANGVFEPLEVALNKVFGITENRSFVKNQIVSMGLIFVCGGLLTMSTVLTALNQQYLQQTLGSGAITSFMVGAFFKIVAVPMTVFTLYLVYKFLPNGEVSNSRAVPAAIVIGLLLEVLKYIVVASWPWFGAKLDREYSGFRHSVAIVLWSFLAAMLLLAGAEWAARRRGPTVTP
jgi:uncharacterized BrkB/YihY/UPF0761 family membrane protein